MPRGSYPRHPSFRTITRCARGEPRDPCRRARLQLTSAHRPCRRARKHQRKTQCSGCPRPQSEERRPRHSARFARRLHRSERLRKVQSRVRHDLRRGPAAIRRIAQRVRAPVPRSGRPARCRLHRGPQPGGAASTRSRRTATRARRSARSPRSTTTCACSGRASACRTAPSAARSSSARPCSRSPISSWSCPTRPATRSSRRS